MANYCYNFVQIKSNNKEVIQELNDLFSTYNDHNGTFTAWGDTFFKKFKDFKCKDDEPFYEYGTKWWDFDQEYYEHNNEEFLLVIKGDSAWSPPSKLIQLIAKYYNVNCTLEYSEPGCDFAGESEWNGQELISNYETSYHDFIYDKEGIHYLLNEFIDNHDEEEFLNFKNFDEYLDSLPVTVTDEEHLEILEEKFDEMRPPKLNKENALLELDEIIKHLSNLSMEKLANKVENLKIALENEWNSTKEDA